MQQVLSEHSHVIRSRLGFHEVTEDVCSRIGIVILQLAGCPEACNELEEALGGIDGLEIQRMVFNI